MWLIDSECQTEKSGDLALDQEGIARGAYRFTQFVGKDFFACVGYEAMGPGDDEELTKEMSQKVIVELKAVQTSLGAGVIRAKKVPAKKKKRKQDDDEEDWKPARKGKKKLASPKKLSER